jgi:peptidyl-prolyl cis-trans isomerase C
VKSFLYLTMAGALAFGQAPAVKKAAAAVKPAAPVKPVAVKPVAVKPVAARVKPVKPVAVNPNDPVVLTVGDEKVTKGEFEGFMARLPEQLRQQLASVPKRQVAQDYANLRVLAAEAKRRKLDETDEVRQQIQLQSDNILINALYRDVEKGVNVSDAAMQKYFDENKAQFEKVKARHILIRFKDSPVPVRGEQKDLTKEEALAKLQGLKKQIEGGADFAELAKKESDDTGSGANGGDLGAFGRGQMVPPFEQAAFALPVGKLSEPVESQFGYHLIQVQEQQGKDFASAKEQIAQRLKPETARKQMEEIRTSGKVTFDEGYFGPATAPPPAAAPPGAVPPGAPPAPPQL